MESLQGALGVLKEYPTVIEQPNILIPKPRQTDNEQIYYEVRKLEQFLLDKKMDKDVKVEVTADGIKLSIVDSVLFASAQAVIQPGAELLLDKIAIMVDGVSKDVTISGHTDSRPINTVRFPSNWDLSAARAISVAKRFQGHGIDPKRMSAVGYGEFRPLETNETEAGRTANRRVEIFLKTSVDDGAQPQGLPLEQVGESNG
jgi:chemotaxis protein MotB